MDIGKNQGVCREYAVGLINNGAKPSSTYDIIHIISDDRSRDIPPLFYSGICATE